MLAALLIGGLTGCYEDKGNYKYRDINEVTYKILPESEDGYYRFKQPPVDTITPLICHRARQPTKKTWSSCGWSATAKTKKQ